jgi:WD40 repeat protein/transcriptional regulator with XRE-family HTH domain
MAEQPVLGFAGLLRQLRAQARLTQEELAEAAGLSPRSVSDLERGINRTARQETAEVLADALGLAEPARAVFVAAARGRAPAAEVLAALQGHGAPGIGPVWAGCPYLGLVPFEERDARVFYGRGELTDQLAQRLAAQLDGSGILLVAGESGTGKSSLLRAGLMPRLAAGVLGPGSERWPRRVIRPTASPLRELAVQLADVSGADAVSVHRSLSAVPDEAPMLVELAVRTATRRSAHTRASGPVETAWAAPRLVLAVDQFEELFTVGGDADADRVEREAFIAALHAAATGPAGPRQLPPALVVAAVRADFVGRLIAYPPLKAALEAGPLTVGPMSEAELRLAITGPAAEAGLTVEPAVVEAVIAELREGSVEGLGSGVLPLMSQAMAATWEHREGRELTLRSYRRAGGVADAVNRSAQAAYDTLTSAQKDAARLVFTQLTVITPDGQFARRRCSQADLHAPGVQAAADADAVIDVFGAHRLLVLGQDSVEIAHDVLLQAWKQLRDWLGDDQLDRALYSQVVTDADTWDSNRRDSAYLYRPGRLVTIDAAVTRWQDAPTRYPPLPATSKAFLGAAHHAARHSTRRRRSAFAVLALLTLLAVAASVLAFSQRAAAIRQRDEAIYNQVIAEALQYGSSDTSLAAQLNLAAYRIRPTQDLASRLLNTENTPLSAPVAAGAGSVNSVAFEQAGHTLAGGTSDGTVQLWDVADPAHPRRLGSTLTGPAAVNWVAFSPDGHTLASGSLDGTIRLWDATDPARPRPLGQPLTSRSGVLSVAFTPSGHTLASGSFDGTVRLWDVADPVRPRPLGRPLTGGVGAVEMVAFSPGGRTLASSDDDGTVRLWDVTDPARPRPLGRPLTASTRIVYSVAFSPDGHTLASGSADGTVRVWDVTDPAHPRPLGQPLTGGYIIESVAFSFDGHTLAGGSADGTVRLWDVTDPAHPSPLGQPLTSSAAAVVSVAFSSDGHTLASGSLDGTIRLWNLPETVLTSHVGGVLVAFSSDGHTLASGSADGAVRLWGVADPARPRPLGQPATGGIAAVTSVAFSPGGYTLAGGDYDGAVRLWGVTDPARPRPLGRPLTGGTGPVTSVAFSPGGHTLASGNYDGTVRLWDVTNPARPRPLGRPLTGGYIIDSVAFSPDGHTLASGSADGAVRLWDVTDLARPRPLGQPLTGSTAAVTKVVFSPGGHTLASGSTDGTVRLWDVTDSAHPRPLGQPLTGNTAAVTSVAFSPSGKTLASGSADGTTRLWNLSTQYAIQRICATAGGLTPRQWTHFIPQLQYQPSCGH